jgi:hypothetical protein
MLKQDFENILLKIRNGMFEMFEIMIDEIESDFLHHLRE